ncbi:hypothetical protein KAH94_00230 [bacterium]|nr:hypothetical protein [bacterium]
MITKQFTLRILFCVTAIAGSCYGMGKEITSIQKKIDVLDSLTKNFESNHEILNPLIIKFNNITSDNNLFKKGMTTMTSLKNAKNYDEFWKIANVAKQDLPKDLYNITTRYCLSERMIQTIIENNPFVKELSKKAIQKKENLLSALYKKKQELESLLNNSNLKFVYSPTKITTYSGIEVLNRFLKK